MRCVDCITSWVFCRFLQWEIEEQVKVYQIFALCSVRSLMLMIQFCLVTVLFLENQGLSCLSLNNCREMRESIETLPELNIFALQFLANLGLRNIFSGKQVIPFKDS